MSELKYLGLDLSLSGTGICAYYENGDIFLKTIKTTPNHFKNFYRRVDHICDVIMSLMFDSVPEMVCIEKPFISKGSMGSNDKLIYLGMSVRKQLCYMGVPFFDVHNAHLKMFATGKGKAEKELMIAAAEMENIHAQDDNQADAYFLCKMAAEIINFRAGGELIGKKKEAVLKTIDKGN